ncbi:MAG TPA: NAD(P)-binding oxidoreductase [Kribbella sp.]
MSMSSRPWWEGDAGDPATLRRALPGADAVISTVPGGNRAHPHAAEEVTTAIVSAMREYDVARLVVTSAYPVVGDRPRLPMWVLRRLPWNPYADVARMEQIVAGSNLDRTTSPELLDHPAPISRRDVAALLVGLLESPGAVRNALNVTTAARA